MKKEYIKPQTESLLVKTDQMLALSIVDGTASKNYMILTNEQGYHDIWGE